MSPSSPDLEARIIKKVIKVLLDAGYVISVNDGEVTTVNYCRDPRTIFRAMRTTDQDILYVDQPIPRRVGNGNHSFVHFVHGLGPDIISDHGASLEELLAPIFSFIDETLYP
jgi:hypothetical protein